MNKINSTLNHMQLVNENLKKLFLTQQDFNDHDSYLLFRGKVSKRIVYYASLISQCNNNISVCENADESVDEYVKEKLEYHIKTLRNYKRELSKWWMEHKKNYYRLCVHNILDKKKCESHDTIKTSGTDVNDLHLKDTKNMMINEINRMKNAKSQLLESSHILKKQDKIFTMFESRLKSSAQLILSIRKKAEKDSKYVWYSFFFFVSVCCYIILRRLGFIRAIITLIKLLFFAIFYLLKFCIRVFYLFKTKNKENDFSTSADISKSVTS
ncbi:protein transport protein SEC20, putative [Hepatocystis sp. ex Piliocolobus tephrosceles]|nr:protein transport protein SEC20, putative [Hepatocystis sp. ex Piliocolobus tephrosceles]